MLSFKYSPLDNSKGEFRLLYRLGPRDEVQDPVDNEQPA